MIGSSALRQLVWVGFVASVSAAIALGIVRFRPASGGAAQDVARSCAVLALVWSVCAAAVPRRRRVGGLRTAGHSGFVALTGTVALQLGVVAVVIESVVVTMRMIYVAVELVDGHPSHDTPDYGFGIDGLWTLGFVFAACATALLSTRDRRLGTCQFWSAIMMASWACLLAPPLRGTATGGFERTSNTLVLLAALSVLVALAVMINGWLTRRGRWRIVHGWHGQAELGRGRTYAQPNELDRAAQPRPWPGLAFSTAVIAVAVILLACYHLAVPVAVGPGGFRVSASVVTSSTALAAFACFLLVRTEWRASLADTGMALTSLSLCGLATLAVPSQPAALAERYPMIFNAMIVGLALGTGLWTYLASMWERQLAGGVTVPPAASAGRLIPYAKRFAFLSAALALVLGAVMAAWPRWPAIATMDDSFGRITAGFGGNLFFLLVMLWCSRRLHRLAFQILTVLTVLSTMGFLIIRMLPFISSWVISAA